MSEKLAFVIVIIAVITVIVLVYRIIIIKNNREEIKQEMIEAKRVVNLLEIFLSEEVYLQALILVPRKTIYPYLPHLEVFFKKMLRQDFESASNDIDLLLENSQAADGLLLNSFKIVSGKTDISCISNLLANLFLAYLKEMLSQTGHEEINEAAKKYLNAKNLLLPSVQAENKEKLIGLINSFVNGNEIIKEDEEAILVFQAEMIQIKKILRLN